MDKTIDSFKMFITQQLGEEGAYAAEADRAIIAVYRTPSYGIVGTGVPDGPTENLTSMDKFSAYFLHKGNDFGASSPKIVKDRPGGRSLHGIRKLPDKLKFEPSNPGRIRAVSQRVTILARLPVPGLSASTGCQQTQSDIPNKSTALASGAFISDTGL